MYSQRGAIGPDGRLVAAKFLENHAEPGEGAEMVVVQVERPGDVGHRGTELPGHVEGGRPRVPAFGEVRRVIGERGQMLDRDGKVARLHRVAPALRSEERRVGNERRCRGAHYRTKNRERT